MQNVSSEPQESGPRFSRRTKASTARHRLFARILSCPRHSSCILYLCILLSILSSTSSASLAFQPTSRFDALVEARQLKD